MHIIRPSRGATLFAGIALVTALLGAGCATGQLVARTTTSVLDGSLDAMNRETDLELAEAAMPSSLKLIEGLINEDPKNVTLREYAAQGFYGYSFGFVEDDSPERASELYRRCLEHALGALRLQGLRVDPMQVSEAELHEDVDRLGERSVPGLFWGASCWAKWIDMNRDDPVRLAEIGRAAALMERVLSLDENYFYGGPHLFFGIYYGSRPPMLGGDYEKAKYHFDRAQSISGGSAFIVDVLYAQYLDRQELNREDFHARLVRVIEGSVKEYPDVALANRIAQRKAQALLEKEEEWF